MYFQLHIWVHMIISNSALPPAGEDLAPRAPEDKTGSGPITPFEQVRFSGAKTICECLTLCEIVNPLIYCTCPILGQPLFAAALILIRGERRHYFAHDQSYSVELHRC